MCWRERVVAHLHGLYRIVRLLDGVDFYPLSRVRQKELIDDLYLVIGGLDGSESLRRRHSYAIDDDNVDQTRSVQRDALDCAT